MGNRSKNCGWLSECCRIYQHWFMVSHKYVIKPISMHRVDEFPTEPGRRAKPINPWHSCVTADVFVLAPKHCSITFSWHTCRVALSKFVHVYQVLVVRSTHVEIIEDENTINLAFKLYSSKTYVHRYIYRMICQVHTLVVIHTRILSHSHYLKMHR